MAEIEEVRVPPALVSSAPNRAIQNRTRGCAHLSQNAVLVRMQSNVALCDFSHESLLIDVPIGFTWPRWLLISVRQEKVDNAVVMIKLHIRTFISTTNDDSAFLPYFVLPRRTICTNYGNRNLRSQLDCHPRGS